MEFYNRFVTVDGPRSTGSPAHRASAEWARQRFASMGLEDARLEPFEFGRGWELRGSRSRWSRPATCRSSATPRAGRRDRGRDRGGPRLHRRPDGRSKVKPARGRSRGRSCSRSRSRPASCARIAMSRPRATAPGAHRCSADATHRPLAGRFQRRTAEILRGVGAGAFIRPDPGEHGTMFVLGRERGGGGAADDRSAAEHYNMLVRMLAAGLPVKLRVEIGARYLEADRSSYNVLAEILAPMRKSRTRSSLLAAISLVAQCARRDRQRRRRRRGPGSGPDPGRRSAPSRAARYASRCGAAKSRDSWDPRPTRRATSAGPANAAAREKFNVYFNIDPGTGLVYGWYLQGQPELASLFDAWLAPFQTSAHGATCPTGLATPITSVLPPWACPGSTRFRTTSIMTCARTTPTWIPSTAGAKRTWRSLRSCSRRSPGTRQCGTR